MSSARVNKATQTGTRERIRSAALHEFATHGFSGARVERIARRARVNIRMIYYFFGSKRMLLEAVLGDIFQRRLAQQVSDFDSAGDLLARYFDGYAEDHERVRLLQWESLQTRLPGGAGKLTDASARRAAIRRRVESIRDLQRRDLLPAGLDPQLLYLAFVALAIYPMSYPQSVYIATGRNPASPAFRRTYRSFLETFAQLALSTRKKPARRTRGKTSR